MEPPGAETVCFFLLVYKQTAMPNCDFFTSHESSQKVFFSSQLYLNIIAAWVFLLKVKKSIFEILFP